MTNRQLLQLKKRYIKEGYKKALVEAQSLRQQMGDEWYEKYKKSKTSYDTGEMDMYGKLYNYFYSSAIGDVNREYKKLEKMFKKIDYTTEQGKEKITRQAEELEAMLQHAIDAIDVYFH